MNSENGYGSELREAAAEIDRLTAALADARGEALEEAAVAMENFCFFTPIDELRDMSKQQMSVRTCLQGAKAIRAIERGYHRTGGVTCES